MHVSKRSARFQLPSALIIVFGVVDIEKHRQNPFFCFVRRIYPEISPLFPARARLQEMFHALHWVREGVEYASKTIAKKELKITNEQWRAIIVKSYKENLQLRQKTIENGYNRTCFTVYVLNDLKAILQVMK